MSALDRIEPQYVRRPDYSRGEKSMYSLEEMISLLEEKRVLAERVEARNNTIRTLETELKEIERRASRCLEDQPRADPLAALRDVISRADRTLR